MLLTALHEHLIIDNFFHFNKMYVMFCPCNIYQLQFPEQIFHSLLSHATSDILNHPSLVLVPKQTSSVLLNSFPPALSLLNEPLPCGVHLLNLRSLSSKQSALFLHQRGVDCSFVLPASAVKCSTSTNKVGNPNSTFDIPII